mmetsp:Transcript_35492/g.84091  ORF Transcript_35492/g.84091 Transcript_35492/m.84091 type:complete len:232 (+) Transcript_35492:381-1076(+)
MFLHSQMPTALQAPYTPCSRATVVFLQVGMQSGGGGREVSTVSVCSGTAMRFLMLEFAATASAKLPLSTVDDSSEPSVSSSVMSSGGVTVWENPGKAKSSPSEPGDGAVAGVPSGGRVKGGGGAGGGGATSGGGGAAVSATSATVATISLPSCCRRRSLMRTGWTTSTMRMRPGGMLSTPARRSTNSSWELKKSSMLVASLKPARTVGCVRTTIGTFPFTATTRARSIMSQ